MAGRTTIDALKGDPAFARLKRSLEVYYGDPSRDAAMDALYARFLEPGHLAFDIGAHVGDRIGSFRRLGARVVALEPQPLCARAIRAIYADDPEVTVREAACGPRPGTLTLHINYRNPDGHHRLRGVRESRGRCRRLGGTGLGPDRRCAVTTLDALVAEHGRPVRQDRRGGFRGRRSGRTFGATARLSFEFTTIQRDVAVAAWTASPCSAATASTSPSARASALPSKWIRRRMAAIIAALPHDANSGDVYCVLQR